MAAPIDLTEIREADAELKFWAPLIPEMPRWLREEFKAVAMLPAGRLASAEQEGAGVTVVLTPRLRTLIANLRAQRRARS